MMNHEERDEITARLVGHLNEINALTGWELALPSDDFDGQGFIMGTSAYIDSLLKSKSDEEE
jgi:hypothetical protein